MVEKEKNTNLCRLYMTHSATKAPIGSLLLLAMWTAGPAAGAAFASGKVFAGSANPFIPRGLLLGGFNPAYPFIPCEWRNIFPCRQ